MGARCRREHSVLVWASVATLMMFASCTPETSISEPAPTARRALDSMLSGQAPLVRGEADDRCRSIAPSDVNELKQQIWPGDGVVVADSFLQDDFAVCSLAAPEVQINLAITTRSGAEVVEDFRSAAEGLGSNQRERSLGDLAPHIVGATEVCALFDGAADDCRYVMSGESGIVLVVYLEGGAGATREQLAALAVQLASRSILSLSAW